MTLEQKTLAYWCLTSYPMSARDAIALSNDLLSQLDPARNLAKRVAIYLDRVIIGGRRKKAEPRNNVVLFKRVPNV
jgi:hypothetical protein